MKILVKILFDNREEYFEFLKAMNTMSAPVTSSEAIKEIIDRGQEPEPVPKSAETIKCHWEKCDHQIPDPDLSSLPEKVSPARLYYCSNACYYSDLNKKRGDRPPTTIDERVAKVYKEESPPKRKGRPPKITRIVG